VCDDGDTVLREKARGVIAAGELPDRPPDRLWGGPATGVRCVVCGEPTTEGEVEFTYDGHAEGRSYYAHPRCLRIFEIEISRPARPAGEGASSRPGAGRQHNGHGSDGD
jgi:hypothetical protein